MCCGVLIAVRHLGSSRDYSTKELAAAKYLFVPLPSQPATGAANPRAKLACTFWDSMGMTDFDAIDTGSDTGSPRGISLSALRLRRFTADKVAWALARNDTPGAPQAVICYTICCKRPAPGTNHHPGPRCSLAGPNRGSSQRGDGERRPWGSRPSTPLHPTQLLSTSPPPSPSPDEPVKVSHMPPPPPSASQQAARVLPVLVCPAVLLPPAAQQSPIVAIRSYLYLALFLGLPACVGTRLDSLTGSVHTPVLDHGVSPLTSCFLRLLAY